MPTGFQKRMAQVGDWLNARGRNFRNFDTAYSKAIGDMYEDLPQGWGAVSAMGQSFGGAVPLGGKVTDETFGGPTAFDAGMQAALPYINAIPKYAAPVAGLTLAGQGLAGITNHLMASTGGPADGQSPGELPFDQTLAGGIALGASAGAIYEGGMSAYRHMQDPRNRIITIG